MISAMLDGGMAARMFQVSTTYALALDNDDICAFDFTKGSMSQGHALLTYRNNIFKKLQDLPVSWKWKYYYHERRYDYDPIPYHTDIILQGYFGSFKYFNHRRKEVIELFRNPEITDNINLNFRNSISLHVRRGDYLENASHICGEDYYKKALEFIDSQTQIDHIYVVSDDIPWCKKTFKDQRIQFIEGPDYLDFYIQTLCPHNILANSAFSSMATFLNENENKIVVAPAIWHGVIEDKDFQDIFCNDWNFI
jgi:hypothetical protein